MTRSHGRPNNFSPRTTLNHEPNTGLERPLFLIGEQLPGQMNPTQQQLYFARTALRYASCSEVDEQLKQDIDAVRLRLHELMQSRGLETAPLLITAG